MHSLLRESPWVMKTADDYLEFLPEVLPAFHKYVSRPLTLLCHRRPNCGVSWVHESSQGPQQDESNKNSLTLPLYRFLLQCQSEFIFLLMGDYDIYRMDWGLLDETIDQTALHLGRLPDKLELSFVAKKWPHSPLGDGGTILRDPGSKYLASLQPALWKTSALRDLILTPGASVPINETPWEFEINGTQRMRQYVVVGHKPQIIANRDLAESYKDESGRIRGKRRMKH